MAKSVPGLLPTYSQVSTDIGLAKSINRIKITSSSQKVIENELKPLMSAAEAIAVSTAE